MGDALHILYLSSWYPSRKDPTLGIFVKRHAQAAAILNRITLLHATADAEMLEGEFRIEKAEEGNFRELLVYYGPSRSKIGLFRKLKNLKLKRKYYRFGLKKVLERGDKFDLVHLHIPWPLGLIARNISKDLKIPYLVSEHWTGYQPEDGRYKGSLVKSVTKKTTADAAAVIVVSEHLRQAMESQGIPGRYLVIPNVVDTDLFKPAHSKPDEVSLIHVSSLDDQQKNVSGIIRAFARARKTEPTMSLTIIGSGGDESKLKKLGNELGLSGRHLFFAGRKLEEELAIAFQNATAFVLNSRFETQGVVLLEALASGIPVIAPAIGGIDPGIADGKGILFKPGDEDALTEAILEVIRNRSHYHAKDIRHYAIEHYSYPVISGRLNQVYREILNQ